MGKHGADHDITNVRLGHGAAKEIAIPHLLTSCGVGVFGGLVGAREGPAARAHGREAAPRGHGDGVTLKVDAPILKPSGILAQVDPFRGQWVIAGHAVPYLLPLGSSSTSSSTPSSSMSSS